MVHRSDEINVDAYFYPIVLVRLHSFHLCTFVIQIKNIIKIKKRMFFKRCLNSRRNKCLVDLGDYIFIFLELIKPQMCCPRSPYPKFAIISILLPFSSVDVGVELLYLTEVTHQSCNSRSGSFTNTNKNRVCETHPRSMCNNFAPLYKHFNYLS